MRVSLDAISHPSKIEGPFPVVPGCPVVVLTSVVVRKTTPGVDFCMWDEGGDCLSLTGSHSRPVL